MLAACAARGPVSGPRPYEFAVEPGTTFDLGQGRAIDREALLRRMAGARLVFLGESHDDLRSHRFQADVLRALAASGRPVTVALEMFPPSADPTLERWRRGEIDEEAFLRASGWYDAWGFAWRLYREAFRVIRAEGLAVHGINATAEQRAAAREGRPPPGVEDMALDPSVAPHRDYLWHTLRQGGHGPDLRRDSERFGALVRVQVLWDELMGRRAARLARQGPPEGVVVVLIGAGHLAHGLGANLRATREAPALPRLTVMDLQADQQPRDARGRALLPVGLADVVRVLSPEGEPHIPSLGGLRLAEHAEGVRVAGVRVLGESPLRRFRAGDVILAMEGKPVRDPVSLRLRFEALDPSRRAAFRIRRDGDTLELAVPATPEAGAASAHGR